MRDPLARLITEFSALKTRVAALEALGRPAPFKGALLTRISSTQTISTGTWTPVEFNNEILDYGGMHESVTNPERITCVSAGLYIFFGWAYIESNSTGERFTSWKKNGVYVYSNSTPASASYGTHFRCAGAVDLAVNDYLTFEIYQDSGGDLDLDTAGSVYARCSVIKVK